MEEKKGRRRGSQVGLQGGPGEQLGAGMIEAGSGTKRKCVQNNRLCLRMDGWMNGCRLWCHG